MEYENVFNFLDLRFMSLLEKYHVRTSIGNEIAKPELYASHKREEREH